MPRYEHPDVSFEVPRDWDDRSVAAFAAPVGKGKKTGPTVVLTRDKLEPGENLASYADRSLVELVQRLERFSLQKRADLLVADLPAIELRFTWKGHSGLVDQRLVMCATGKRLVLSITSTAPRPSDMDIDAVMNRILASVRIPGVRGESEG